MHQQGDYHIVEAHWNGNGWTLIPILFYVDLPEATSIQAGLTDVMQEAYTRFRNWEVALMRLRNSPERPDLPAWREANPQPQPPFGITHILSEIKVIPSDFLRGPRYN